MGCDETQVKCCSAKTDFFFFFPSEITEKEMTETGLKEKEFDGEVDRYVWRDREVIFW